MQLTEVQKPLADSSFQTCHVLYLFHKKYFLLFGFILLWEAYMSTWSHPDESYQTAFIMASFFLTEMALLNENHLSALTVLSCWPAWDTPSTACVKNTAFTWARHGQAVVSAASSKHGLYLHQPMFSQALGKKPVHFLTASMYNLHVQLFGGFWSRPSHARTDFAPVESRTKLYSTLTEAEASCESPVTRSFS